MRTDVIYDYAKLDIEYGSKNITVSRDGEMVYLLTPDLVEGNLTALLRVNGNVSFYNVSQSGELAADNLDAMFHELMRKVPEGLFYLSGICAVKNRKSTNKTTCRAVVINTTTIALRNQRLIFAQLYVRGLGSVNLDDTGDTTAVYQQLNNLI